MNGKTNKKKTGRGLTIALMLVIVAAMIAVILWEMAPRPVTPPTAKPAQTESASAASTAAATDSQPVQTEPEFPLSLDYGLEIVDAGKYTGMYMEDGSNEVLGDVMMIAVRNSGSRDIQLANISALCGGEEYHFVLTNLASGAEVILLDQNRKSASDGRLEAVQLENVAVFEEPMDLREDVLLVSGLEGMLNVQNISDTDISGDIYIYYKYVQQDVFYGGITFRVRIEGGLKAGELRQITTGHYLAEGSAIVQVTIYE